MIIEAPQIDEEFAEEVAEILIHDGDREPWFVALEMGHHLDSLELRELERLLWTLELVGLCEVCESCYVDPEESVCLFCLEDDDDYDE